MFLLRGEVGADFGESRAISLAWPPSCLCLFSLTFSVSIFPFCSLFIWQMSYVRTDHRQIPPGGQPLEGNIKVWVDRLRHKLGSEVCVKSEGKLVASPLRVVFSELDAFPTSPRPINEHHLWTREATLERSCAPGAVGTLFHSVLSLAPSDRCHWLLHVKKVEAQRGYVTCPTPQSLF